MANGGTGSSVMRSDLPSPNTRSAAQRRWRRLTIALVLLCGAAASANAQMGGHGGRQKSQQQASQQTTPPPPPPIMAEAWPRLDIGAILCKSRDDLVSYQMRVAAGPGAAPPRPAPDCLIIQQQTAIQILDRDGPSRTHVVATDASKRTGWTDAYLPATPPPSVATAAGTGQKP
jgi:hypothetical protein